MRAFLIIAWSIFYMTKAQANTHLTVHSASYAGMFALGGGFATSSQHIGFEVESLLGYVPERISDSDIWSLSLRLRMKSPAISLNDSWQWQIVNIGVQGLFALDDDFFLVLPSRYPKNYYPPTGFHWGPLLGTEIHWQRISIYFELASLVVYWNQYKYNKGQLTYKDVISIGSGVRYYFY